MLCLRICKIILDWSRNSVMWHAYILYVHKKIVEISQWIFNLKFKTDILIRYFYQYAWNPYLHKLLRVHHKMDFLSFVIRHYIFKLWILIKHLQLIEAMHMIHMRFICSTLLCFKMIVLLNSSGFLNMVKKLKPNLLQMYWVKWIHILTNLMEQSTCIIHIFTVYMYLYLQHFPNLVSIIALILAVFSCLHTQMGVFKEKRKLLISFSLVIVIFNK